MTGVRICVYTSQYVVCRPCPEPCPWCVWGPRVSKPGLAIQERWLSYIICVLQVMMQVSTVHSETPTLLLAYIMEMPAYEYLPHLHRLVEIHTEIPLCTYTKTHRPPLHKRCCSLTKYLTQRYVRAEEKNLQLCRKPFSKSPFRSPKCVWAHSHRGRNAPAYAWILNYRPKLFSNALQGPINCPLFMFV